MAYSAVEHLTGQFFATAAFFSSLIAALTALFVVRNEFKRRARRDFRIALATEPSTRREDVKLQLAQLMVEAIRNHRFDPVRKIESDRILRNYIVDIDFKRKLYFALMNEISRKGLTLSQDDARSLIGVVAEWRNQELDIKKSVEGLLRSDELNYTLRSARWFLDAKNNYFEEKRNALIDDVNSAIWAASVEQPRMATATQG